MKYWDESEISIPLYFSFHFAPNAEREALKAVFDDEIGFSANGCFYRKVQEWKLVFKTETGIGLKVWKLEYC